jgi:hypothetical protein
VQPENIIKQANSNDDEGNSNDDEGVSGCDGGLKAVVGVPADESADQGAVV